MSPDRNPGRGPKSERAHLRAVKAEVRRDSVPSTDQRISAETKAKARLTGLSQSLFGLIKVWVNQTGQAEFQTTLTNIKSSLDSQTMDHDTSLAFGKLMAEYSHTGCVIWIGLAPKCSN